MQKKEFIGNALGGALAGVLGVIALEKASVFLYDRQSEKTCQKENEARAQVGGAELSPTTILVNKISDRLPNRLSERQSNALANIIHYSLGVVPGAFYGAMLGKNKHIDTGRGFFYGLGLFLFNDEILSVKLGLSAPPRAYPWQSHARGFLSHVALGMTTHWGCKAFQRLFKPQATSGV